MYQNPLTAGEHESDDRLTVKIRLFLECLLFCWQSEEKSNHKNIYHYILSPSSLNLVIQKVTADKSCCKHQLSLMDPVEMNTTQTLFG